MHASLVRSMEQTACTIGIDVTGEHYCDVELYDAEHYTGGNATTYDLDEPSDYLHGNVRWVRIAIGGTNDHTFNVNGAGNGPTASSARCAGLRHHC